MGSKAGLVSFEDQGEIPRLNTEYMHSLKLIAAGIYVLDKKVQIRPGAGEFAGAEGEATLAEYNLVEHLLGLPVGPRDQILAEHQTQD